MNVILADHQRVFRVGMVYSLASEDDIRIVGQPSTPEQLLRGIETFRPHVVVLSSAFVRHVDAIQAACRRQQTALVLLLDYGAPMASCLYSEFHAVLDRTVDVGTLVHVLRHLSRGGTVIPTKSDAATAPRHTGPEPTVRRRLKEREMQIVRCVVTGLRNREIAELMGSNESAVKNALGKIFAKTGVFGRLELALLMVHEGTMAGPKPRIKLPRRGKIWRWSGDEEESGRNSTIQ